MSYTLHYRIPFKNIKTGIDCRFDILEKDYAGDFVILKGAARSPVVHSWDGASILDPIRGSKCVVQYVYQRSTSSLILFSDDIIDLGLGGSYYVPVFEGSPSTGDVIRAMVRAENAETETYTYTVQPGDSLSDMITGIIALVNAGVLFTASSTSGIPFFAPAAGRLGLTISNVAGSDISGGSLEIIRAGSIPITEFLTTDETKFRGDFYVNNVLKFTGYMVIDDFIEPYLTPPVVPTLTFTDGLALLDNITLADVEYDERSGRQSIFSILYFCLAKTNLVLPLRVYYNLFPFTDTYYVDRNTDPTTLGIELQWLNTNSFLIGDSGFETVKEVFVRILKANKSILLQQDGEWVIVRQPEYKRFSGNIPGGRFYQSVYSVAPDLGQITIGKTGDLIPIERAQQKQFTRPTKSVTNTFNYNIPQLLTNSNLARLGDFISSSVVGDNTVTHYELSDWNNQNNEAAFIRVTTVTLTGKEVGRDIYMPVTTNNPLGADPDGLRSVPIEVNEGDRMAFSFSYKPDSTSASTTQLRWGMHLQSLDGSLRRTLTFTNNANPADNRLFWGTTTQTNSNFGPNLPALLHNFSVGPVEYVDVSLTDPAYNYNNFPIPRFPFDGVLTIIFTGFNNDNAAPNKDCILKNFEFKYFLFINDTIQIIGQENKADQNVISKNAVAAEIFVDSSPKFNIAGGIFCSDGTRLVLAQDFRKASGDTTNYRHGEVNAIDELLLSSNWRTLFEGNFYGLCNPTDSASIDGLDGLFVPFKLSLDYRQNIASASFMEVSKGTDPTFDELAYAFRYLYKAPEER